MLGWQCELQTNPRASSSLFSSFHNSNIRLINLFSIENRRISSPRGYIVIVERVVPRESSSLLAPPTNSVKIARVASRIETIHCDKPLRYASSPRRSFCPVGSSPLRDDFSFWNIQYSLPGKRPFRRADRVGSGELLVIYVDDRP